MHSIVPIHSILAALTLALSAAGQESRPRRDNAAVPLRLACKIVDRLLKADDNSERLYEMVKMLEGKGAAGAKIDDKLKRTRTRFAEVFALLDMAAQASTCQFKTKPDEALQSEFTQLVESLSRLGNLSALDAAVSLERGDIGGCIRRVSAMLSLAGLLEQHYEHAAKTLGSMLERRACWAIRRVLGTKLRPEIAKHIVALVDKRLRKRPLAKSVFDAARRQLDVMTKTTAAFLTKNLNDTSLNGEVLEQLRKRTAKYTNSVLDRIAKVANGKTRDAERVESAWEAGLEPLRKRQSEQVELARRTGQGSDLHSATGRESFVDHTALTTVFVALPRVDRWLIEGWKNEAELLEIRRRASGAK